VRADVHSEFHLLELAADVLLFLFVVLGEVVFEFTKIHDAAHGRIRRGGDLHEVEPVLLGGSQGVLDFHYPELLAGRGNDHAHFPSADALIDTNLSELDGFIKVGSQRVERWLDPISAGVARAVREVF
jgi:hypothetical protein